MSQRNTISSIPMTLAVGAALLFGAASSGPVWAQTAQQPATAAPATDPSATTPSATAPPATTPGSASMPMQQMQQGHGMMGGMSGGQGHPGPMMGGQGQAGAPMGSMQPCPAGQTASGNPPTCK